MACGNGSSLWGNTNNSYIKFQGNDAVAISGSDTAERLILGDLRFPYKQIIKGRVQLKAGQINYLMNHLGLGDNATFLMMTARYNSKSVIPEDNYVQYSYYNDASRMYTFAQALLLTGNVSQRIPQLYLSNPNATYSVSIDVMVAVVDDTYNFFPDNSTQPGVNIYNLKYTDILTFTIDKTLAVMGPDGVTAVLYIDITDISTIERSDKILIIDQTSIGKVYLNFISEYDALQALSLINWVMEVSGRSIGTNSPGRDDLRPVVSFTSYVYLGLTGSTFSSPTTIDGDNFNTTLTLSSYNSSTITKTDIFSGTYSLISSIVDYDNRGLTAGGLTAAYYRDGVMGVDAGSIIIKNNANTSITSISATGSYQLNFNISDIAGNNLSNVVLSMSVV